NLTGGVQADAFTFQGDQAMLGGLLDGGAQADDATRNAIQGPDLAMTWTVTGHDSGRVDPASGGPVAAGFTNVGNPAGGGDNDTSTSPAGGGTLSGTIDGGGGGNTLQGPGADTNWTIIGPDAGSLADASGQGLVAEGFTQVGNLFGGANTDAFTLQTP